MTQNLQNQDEISLMDLSLIIARRFKSACVSFVVVLSLMSALIMQHERYYMLTSIIDIGSIGSSPIENPEGVKLRLIQGVLPHLLDELNEQGIKNAKSFVVNISHPSNTSIIILESSITKINSETYASIHSSLAKTIVDEHAVIIDKRIQFINKQLAESIKLIADEDVKANTISYANARRSEITHSKLQVIAQKSQFQFGPKHSKLFIAAVFLAFILALITPLCLEFFAQIKLRLENEQ